MSICSIEDVHAASPQPFWFQQYLMRDRGFNKDLIDRAIAAKCSALVLTLDLQVIGERRRDPRNGLSIPPRLTLRNAFDMVTKPGWALSVLLCSRRTFGNLAGRIGGDSGSARRPLIRRPPAFARLQEDVGRLEVAVDDPFAVRHMDGPGERLDERVVDLGSAGDDVAALSILAAGERADASARLLHEQRAGGGIPGVEVELPKAIHTPRGHVRQIKGSRAGAAHAVRAQR